MNPISEQWRFENGRLKLGSFTLADLRFAAATPARIGLLTFAPELGAFVQKYLRETNCTCKLNDIMAKMDVHVPCTNCEARALLQKAGLL